MRFKILIGLIVLMICTTKSTSKCEKVSWNEKRNLWQAEYYFNDKKRKLYFRTEFDASKKLNQLCAKMENIQQNSEIPNQKKKKKVSQYKGVTWHGKGGKWCVQLPVKGEKTKYGGIFTDELDAAKRVNQLCEELGISPQNPEISAISNQQYEKKEKISQFKGVHWHRQSRKWYVIIYPKGQKGKCGGTFVNELEAAKRVNQLCERLKIPLQNPTISAIPTHKSTTKEKTSQYIGVHWSKQRRKWYAQSRSKDRQKSGYFNDEHDAAKKVNQWCDELGINVKNPGINGVPNEQKKKKPSQYVGVYWHKQMRKWVASMNVNGEKKKYGGMFQDELDAAKKVNQLCEKLGIPVHNPTISARPNQHYQAKEKTSQYKGVYRNKTHGKWYARISLKGQKQMYGGGFNNELDAVKKVNELCEAFGISQQNPTIYTISNEQYQKKYKTLLDFDHMRAEFEDLIKILDENNDPTSTIQKNLFAAINYGEQFIMTEINFCTKNGESALSTAAKHGFSNTVKFLISKGADKEHFTNDHHTPLSLAVSHDHLKVVQVLFEKWISPNSHKMQYLHLSPIFNVKSREIAQLLIDNDAVTHEIYNDKNQSPLTVACQNGYLDVVEFFLDDGLNINHLDSDNKTSLFYALTNKHHDVANLLISKGAQNTFMSIN